MDLRHGGLEIAKLLLLSMAVGLLWPAETPTRAPSSLAFSAPSGPASSSSEAAKLIQENGSNLKIGHLREMQSNAQEAVQLRALSLPMHVPFSGLGLGKDRAQEYTERGLKFAQAGDLKGAEAELRRAVELAPNDPTYLADLGRVLGRERKLEESSVFFARVLEIDPQNLTVRLNLAANQWQMGKLKEAKGNLEIVLKAKPGDESAILLLGMVAENLKDFASAARLLSSVPALVRQRPESLAALARSYYSTGAGEKARATLGELLGHPAGPQGVFMGGQVAAEANDYETAEKLFTSVKSSYPDLATLGYNIALVQYRANRFSDSQKTLLDLIGAGYKTTDHYNLLGWCYQKQNKSKEAIHSFEEALDRDPARETNYLDLGMVLVSDKLYPAALAVAKRGVEVLPGSYHVFMLKGLVELKLSQFTDAIDSYSRATRLRPNEPEANLGLALTQFAAGMTQQSAATFEQGIQQFPRDAGHYQEYAGVLLKLAEAGDEAAEARAVSLLETALALDATLSEPHYQLGNVALKRGHADAARQQFELAARLNPTSSKIHYALARAYRRLGRGAEASKEFETYQKLKGEEEKSISVFLPAGVHHDEER